MNEDAFGWLLIGVVILGAWATSRYLSPRLSLRGMWIALGATGAALAMSLAALARLT